MQAAKISLDMQPSGNTYSDPGGGGDNSMTLGSIDNCLTSPTASTSTHPHVAHIVIQDVEDLVGWQVRMNYIGDKFRPNTVNFAPFTDNSTGQNVSFTNLPLDAGVHRDLITASTIPPAPPDGCNTIQTAALGGTYVGSHDFAVSPDTPPKTVPDDSSYSALTGGVLASVTLQVVGDETG